MIFVFKRIRSLLVMKLSLSYRVIPLAVAVGAVMCSSSSYAGFEFDSSAPSSSRQQATIVRNVPVERPSLSIYPVVNDVVKPIEVIRPIKVMSAHKDVSTWKANRGENLADVVARWSNRAEVDFIWTMNEERHIVESVSYFGAFDGALRELFDVGMQGTIEGELSYNNDPLPEPASTISTAVVSVPVTPLVLNTERKWKATKGQTLKSVLNEWQGPGDYTLLWEYPIDLPLPNHFYVYGNTQDALAMLLEQFDVPRQPLAELYNDPRSGEKHLHVK